MASISKGITLGYNETSTESYTTLTNLQEIPELGGEVEGIEITTLDDAAHKFTDGLISYGDSLAFKFLYEKSQFTTLEGFNGSVNWQVKLPDASTCSFSGTCSVKFDGVGVGAPLTYTLNIKPDSEMAWA